MSVTGKTDLASVPGFLLWFVPRYGVHTLAALLHDQQVKDPPRAGRVEADSIFRDALGELKVPWIRRWMMWAAVSLGTTWQSPIGKLRVVVWFVGVLIAAAMFWQHAFAAVTVLKAWPPWLVFGHGMWWDLAVVAALGFVFLPRIGLGWLAGATLVFIFVPTVAVLITTGVYLMLEKFARGPLRLYNKWLTSWLPVSQVETAPVIMTLARGVTLAQDVPRGCPELAADTTTPPTGS